MSAIQCAHKDYYKHRYSPIVYYRIQIYTLRIRKLFIQENLNCSFKILYTRASFRKNREKKEKNVKIVTT